MEKFKNGGKNFKIRQIIENYGENKMQEISTTKKQQKINQKTKKRWKN